MHFSRQHTAKHEENARDNHVSPLYAQNQL